MKSKRTRPPKHWKDTYEFIAWISWLGISAILKSNLQTVLKTQGANEHERMRMAWGGNTWDLDNCLVCGPHSEGNFSNTVSRAETSFVVSSFVKPFFRWFSVHRRNSTGVQKYDAKGRQLAQVDQISLIANSTTLSNPDFVLTPEMSRNTSVQQETSKNETRWSDKKTQPCINVGAEVLVGVASPPSADFVFIVIYVWIPVFSILFHNADGMGAISGWQQWISKTYCSIRGSWRKSLMRFVNFLQRRNPIWVSISFQISNYGTRWKWNWLDFWNRLKNISRYYFSWGRADLGSMFQSVDVNFPIVVCCSGFGDLFRSQIF